MYKFAHIDCAPMSDAHDTVGEGYFEFVPAQAQYEYKEWLNRQPWDVIQAKCLHHLEKIHDGHFVSKWLYRHNQCRFVDTLTIHEILRFHKSLTYDVLLKTLKRVRYQRIHTYINKHFQLERFYREWRTNDKSLIYWLNRKNFRSVKKRFYQDN